MKSKWFGEALVIVALVLVIVAHYRQQERQEREDVMRRLG